MTALALALAGFAVLTSPSPLRTFGVARLRVLTCGDGAARRGTAGATTAHRLARRLVRRGPRTATAGHADTALTADLLAACLVAGLPVPTALRAATGATTGRAADVLRHAADALALGAPARQAWEPARACPETTELARAACRTARSGSAMASAATAVAAQARQVSADAAETRSHRAGVLIVGPLALCFLPAFLCLGVIPVVIGLATRLDVLT